MNISIVASREVFDRAIRDAGAIGRVDVVGPASPLDATSLGRLDAAWDAIVRALTEGFQSGKVKAQGLLDAAIEKAEQLMSEAGSRARDIHNALLARLQEYLHSLIQGALARVPATLKLGDRRCPLSSLRTTQKLVVTGSLRTNLTEVFSITADGEIEISAEYAVAEQ